MNPADFEFLAKLLKDRSGLFLTPDKIPFLEGRLKLVAARRGFKTIASLVCELKAANESLIAAVTEATTIHDTRFFRDGTAFRGFQEILLPQLFRARRATKRLRIWSAAASTGQEAYSVAMMLAGEPQFADWNIDILATDLDPEAIRRAEEGLYGHFDLIRGLKAPAMAKHFSPEGEHWRVKDTIRKRVRFRVFNLLNSYEALGIFDVIFCRNVLIYFDTTTKADILARLADCVAPDGYLALGAAETTAGLGSRLVESPVQGVYVKAKAA